MPITSKLSGSYLNSCFAPISIYELLSNWTVQGILYLLFILVFSNIQDTSLVWLEISPVTELLYTI